MKWTELLNTERPGKNGYSDKDNLGLSPFERDYYTIISSSYFRRLQKKTQVFTLDDNDFVRTRLTHSLEVSAIAEMIARAVAKRIIKEHNEDLPENFENNLPLVARCAGLLHDLGNPPFGHSGERYIREFFMKTENDNYKKLDKQMQLDFVHFEGNAQNLRIMTKLGQSSNPDDNGYGMHLTNAVINSVVKYPMTSLEQEKLNEERIQKGEKAKYGKIGYFKSEQWVLTGENYVMDHTGTKCNGKCLKHPVMLIMEAADDIAYATADLEDAVKKGKITLEELKKILPDSDIFDKIDTVDGLQRALKRIREQSIQDVVNSFMDSYEAIMAGSFEAKDGLVEATSYNLDKIKKYMYDIFDERDRMSESKYASEPRINIILKNLITVIDKNPEDYTFTDVIIVDEIKQYLEKGAAEVAAQTWLSESQTENELTYHKYQAIVDFVSGMTDSYVELFANKLTDSNYLNLEKEKYKKSCIEGLSKAKSFNESIEVMKKMKYIDTFTDIEKALVLRICLNNEQIYKSKECQRLIKAFIEKNEIDSSICKGNIISEAELEKLCQL